MKRNALRRLATIIAVALGLAVSLASNGAAQILLPRPIIPFPVLVQTLVEITAGSQHTCVRKYDGTIHCWGDDALGQVGPSTTTCKAAGSFTATEPCVDKPNYVTTVSTIASQVVAGAFHTCALNAGIAECWGSNLSGELGNGTAGVGTQQTLPQNVLNSPTFNVLAAGPNVTCGLSNTGVYCWGLVPFNSQATTAVKAPSIMDGMHNSGFFTNLTVGKQFACFVAVGSILNENDCQGIDNVGQLGIASNTTQFSMPLGCAAGANASNKPPCLGMAPADIPFIDFLFTSSLSPVLRASAGLDYVCADMPNGTVQCVGNNLNGKLGTGLNNATLANPAAVVNASGASLQLHGVTTGDTHACALDANGSAWCWGIDHVGELGFGIVGAGAFNFAQPVYGGHKFRVLAAGGTHTCGIGTDDYVYCWGDNQFGQLGVGKSSLPTSGFLPATSTGVPQQIPAF